MLNVIKFLVGITAEPTALQCTVCNNRSLKHIFPYQNIQSNKKAKPKNHKCCVKPDFCVLGNMCKVFGLTSRVDSCYMARWEGRQVVQQVRGNYQQLLLKDATAEYEAAQESKLLFQAYVKVVQQVPKYPCGHCSKFDTSCFFSLYQTLKKFLEF